MTSKSVYGVTCVLLIALAFALPGGATTIVMPTDPQMIEKSPVILRGTIVSSEPVEIRDGIWTETRVEVEEILKGDAADSVIVREVGGRIGDRETVVFGSPEFTPGESVLLFLWPSPRGDYQTMDLFLGKFSEEWTLDGQRLWFRPNEVENTRLLDRNFEPIEDAEEIQRDAAAFTNFVRDRAAGLAGNPNYGVANPALVRSVQANFELISEPTVYRWFAFQDGKSVDWKGVGSQPGYANGGVDDTKVAISSWSGYSDANIRYVWGGMSSQAPGGLDKANGINEVMFNDPLDEISGTWTGSGGVVGRGGFNRISGSRSWSSPIAADGTHTTQTYTAYDIVEGNLVLQDGVSPSTGISSSQFAEIIAHEFGHTLGFGHSADTNALMYSSLRGLGPALRSDDELAARWLYPATSSSGTVEVPKAPSNLTATALNSTTVRLAWSDNSAVETSQSVYVDAGSGFAKAGSIGANVTSIDVTQLTSGRSYSFRVTASNSAGESSASNTAAVTLASDAVAASFSVSPTSGTAGTTFTFSDQSTGPVATWQWSFGDGTSSTARNPSKVYATAGTYTVTLTVKGSSGQESTTTRSIAVSAQILPVNAAFAVSPTSGTAGATTFTFTDQSTGPVTSWQWSFGDGSGSTARNPSKIYASSRTYSVTLTARGSSGQQSTTSRSVSVGAPAPTAIPFTSLVPVSTAVAGVGGTSWRTSLTIFNASSFAVPVDVVYLPGAGQPAQTRRIPLGAGVSASWQNVLGELFGISSGAGALHFETSSSNGTPDLRISSRTYTDGSNGTYGQFVGDVRGESIPPRLHLPGLAMNATSRSNIGLVNRGGSHVSPTLSLYGASGSLLGRTTIPLAPGSFHQQSLAAIFPIVSSVPQDQMSLEIASPIANAVTAYASVVDNISQDPVFVQARGGGGNELYVAAVGRTAGAGGTFWRSDLTLHNPGPGSVSATIRFLRSGQDNRFASGRTISLGAKGTQTIRDVMTWLGAGDGSGALQISWSGTSEGVVATSRTYTTRGFDAGTLGQSIAMTPASEFGSRAIVTGLVSDVRYRTNVGVVNSGDATIGVTLHLTLPDGRRIASAFVTVPARSQIQSAAAGLFPSVPQSNLGSFTVIAETQVPTMFAYGSVIDNQSGDPIFVSGR
ncbi:MAG: PKD domain-containing protein [Thermoanaerobaculia bacterium]